MGPRTHVGLTRGQTKPKVEEDEGNEGSSSSMQQEEDEEEEKGCS